jgi:PAS domain S-box-containing protein
MKNEELQQLVFESLGGCRWEYDLPNDRIVYSDEFFDLIGYLPGELEIDSDWVSDNIHPGDLVQWREAFIASIKGNSKYFDCELRFRHKDDYYVWIQTRGVVTARDEQGRALRIVGMVFDISERKSAKENETRYRLLLNTIPDALSLKDREGRYLYVNREFEEWLGKPSYQICGLTEEEIFDPATTTFEMQRDHERRVWQEAETISMERQFPLTADGKIRHAVITKFPVFDESGEILAIGTTNTDVTERFHAQQALLASEQRYRRLFESAPVILAETDWSAGKALVDGLRSQGIDDIEQHIFEHPELLRRRADVMHILTINQEALRVYRTDSEESLRAFLDQEINQVQRLALTRDLVAFAEGNRRSTVHTWARRLDGEDFPITRESEMHSHDADDWSLVMITIRDDSAEEAIRQREKHLRLVFDVAPAVLAESDWTQGKALVEDLQKQGVTDLYQYLVDHPELTRRRDQIMRLTSVNKEALRIYRADDAQALIRHTAGEMNEVQRIGMIEDLVNFANGHRRSTVHCRTFRLDGEEFPMIAESEFYGADPEDWSRVLLTVRDTSAEETVRVSEQRYRQLFESAPAVLGQADFSPARWLVERLLEQGVEDIRQYLIDHPELTSKRSDFMQLVDVNQEALRVYRSPSKESLVRFLNKPLPEEVRLGLIDDLATFASGETRSTIRAWVACETGEKIPIIRVSEMSSSDPGDWSQVLISIRDISAEEAVRMSEMRYRRLFESAPVALYETDWSRGKALVDDLRDRGVDDIAAYLHEHGELLQRRDEVSRVVNLNHEALEVYQAQSREQLSAVIEGPLSSEQRKSLIESLEIFASGRRRSSVRGFSVKANGEVFPMVRDSELISSDRDDWSRVLSSIHDLTAEVESANRLREYQQELRSLAGKISSAEESERRRISSELHDGTIQNLVLARIHLANLRTTLESEKAGQLADSINDLLETSLRETRSLIFEISPPVLYELGLEPAVEWLAEHYKQRTGVSIVISGDEGSTKLSEEMNIVVFQSARELLVNIARHAQASQVFINWRHNADSVVLTIEDNGVGFDTESSQVRLATEGGFGLFALRERLKLMGAEIDIESSGQGTRVNITAPVDGEQKPVTNPDSL